MINPTSPLAERVRPQTLDTLAGQEHLQEMAAYCDKSLKEEKFIQ